MKSEKKVLLLMIEAGGGHKTPAEAIADYLLDYPWIAAESIDLPVEVGKQDGIVKQWDERHKQSWDWMLSHPLFTRLSYHIKEWVAPLVRWYLGKWLSRFTQKGAEYIAEKNPDLVLCIHYFNLYPVLEAKARLGLTAPVGLLVTDPHDFHLFWGLNRPDFIIVSSQDSVEKAAKYGFSSEDLKVFPYPMKKAVFQKLGTVLQGSGLKPGIGGGVENSGHVGTGKGTIAPNDVMLSPTPHNRPSLLLTAGGHGLGFIEKIVAFLLKEDLGWDVTVVCGKNQKLQEVIQCASVPWVHGLGFVTNMPELMSSVDVVGIKAGAATTYEAIALKKPILFIDYVAENERANIYAVLKDNRGWQVNSLSQVSTFLQRIYNNPGELATVQKNAQDFNYLNGGPHIAEYIVKLLD